MQAYLCMQVCKDVLSTRLFFNNLGGAQLPTTRSQTHTHVTRLIACVHAKVQKTYLISWNNQKWVHIHL